MSWYHRLRNLTRTARLNREIERELAFHIAEQADELQAGGMTERDALREARRRLGNPEVQRERTRDADVFTWLDSLLRDVRHAVRGLRRAPVFAVVAVLSLALGIGANTAIFTLIDAVVLRPLPVPAPEELVVLGMDADGGSDHFTNPLWEQIRERQTGMIVVAAFSVNDLNMAAGGEARRVRTARVSGDYFRLFGVRPAHGRLLVASDDVRGCAPAAVLGHAFWRSEYGGDANVIGRTIELEGTSFEIIGVAPNGFHGAEVGSDPQVYVPLCSEDAIRGEASILDARSTWWLRVMGRRERQVMAEELGARLAGVAPSIFEATVPEHFGVAEQEEYRSTSLFAWPADTGVSQLRDRYTGALVLLMAGVALVLLIACANVANLLMARATAREREFAIRMAIGAGRGRLARQLVTESMLFALIGAAVGLLLAHFGARALVALIAPQGDVALDLSLSARVLAFTTAVALLTVLLFGLIPAWRAGRVDPQSTMSAQARGIAGGHSRFTLGKALVAAQVALSLVLLVGAGLLVASLERLVALDPGFRADGIVVASADLRPAGFEGEQLRAARAELLDRLRGQPGVRAASTADITPISGSRWNQEVVVDGYAPENPHDAIVWFNGVSAGHFQAMGTPVLTGRDFDVSDVPEGMRVAIVSESVARKFFGSASPVGRRFRTPMGDDPGDTYTVVGVVGEAKYGSLREEDSGTIYVAASQVEDPWPFVNLVVRTDGDPAGVTPVVKRAIADTHPAIVVDFRILTEQVARSIQRERVLAVLSALFGGVALALAMLGLYGVMSYAVARRRNEIGVRIAIGAGRARVVRMVLGDVARVLVIGMVVGIVAALAAGRLVTKFLYGVEPGEPVVLIASAAVLTLVALGAGLIPAARAARMDPTRALREE